MRTKHASGVSARPVARHSTRTLADERITVAYPAFETIWLGVLNHPDFPTADLSGLRLIQNIAVPERLVQMQKATPAAVEVSPSVPRNARRT